MLQPFFLTITAKSYLTTEQERITLEFSHLFIFHVMSIAFE